MKNIENKENSWALFRKISIAVVGVCLAYLLIVINLSDDHFNEIGKIGALGDSFGIVNALFSGLAFAGVIFAIILQQKELSLQREELKGSRKEFQINRLTTIIYKQLEMYSENLRKFGFPKANPQFIGFGVILHLEAKIQSVKILLETHGSDDKNYGKYLSIVNTFASDIQQDYLHDCFSLSSDLYNSYRFIISLLDNEDIEPEDKSKLFEIFNQNIDKKVIDVLESIGQLLEKYLDQEVVKSKVLSDPKVYQISGLELCAREAAINYYDSQQRYLKSQ